MSSLLRSTKFVRYFTGAARTLILNSAKTAEASSLINPKALSAVNNVLVRDYATTKKTESLEPLLQKLESEVRRFGRISKRDIDEVIDELNGKHNVNSSQLLLVIRCCGELVPEELPEQRTLLVQKIWSVLTERGVPVDISHYNALLRVYLENEHPFSPAKFLEELERKGLQPNRVTYQRLMWRYCQEGDMEGARKVLEKMRELNLPVSEPVLNALVMGHSFHGDTDGAKAVLETMAGAGLEPSNRTYTLLACGHAKKGDIDGVKNIIKTANEKDALMDDRDILDIIEHLAVGGHGDKVEELFPFLHKSAGYNQDVCNLILRLLNKGQEETAKRIMKTMHALDANFEDNFYKGAFFIKQLLRVNKSTESLIKTCRELQTEALVPNALYIATEGALQQGHTELAQELFNELKKDGFQIRQHYFWPLLVKKGKEGDEEGLLQIVRHMGGHGLTPTGECLREYIIPYLIEKDTPENIIIKLQIANVPIVHAARNVIMELLFAGKIEKAAKIALLYQPQGQYTLMSRPLLNALSKTKDIDSFASILHVISVNPTALNEEDTSHDDAQAGDKTDSTEIGRIVKAAVKNLNFELVEKLLKAVHSKGLRISTSAAEEIEQYLGKNMTANLSELLAQLTSPELEAVPLETPRRSAVMRTSTQLEQLIAQLKTREGSNVNRLQKQLITAYVKEKNVEKLDSHIAELRTSGFELNAGVLGQLFEFYCENDLLEKAVEIKNEMATKFPDFTINRFKIVTYAYALVRAKRYDEAIKVLQDNKPAADDDTLGFAFNSKCWQMVNSLAEEKDVERVKEMTQVLITNEYIEASNVILGPSIKVHLLMDDLEGALKEFEHCCNKYRSTPWKGELMKALIMKEDAAKLQWLADLSTQIHGEVNILYDLVLAFVECGRLQQARRILKTPGLQSRPRRLDTACERYVQEGKSEYLEGLLEATKELSHIDRSNIFYHLLKTYCKANETDKALGLWTLLQEEGEVPSEQFLQYLGNHLKSQNRPVPFVLPEEPKQKKEKREVKKQNTTAQETPIYTKSSISDNIENLVKNGETTQAMDAAVKSIEKGVIPERKVMKFMLKALAEAGQVEKIEALGKYLSDEQKRDFTYDDKLTMAVFAKGKGAEHVGQLYEAVSSATDDQELQLALRKFPRSVALGSVMSNPDIVSTCQKVAEIAASKGQLTPVNLLWMEYLLTDKHSEADALYNSWLKDHGNIMFRRLLQEAHTRNQPILIEKLIDCLKSNQKASPGSVGNAYSRLINLYLTTNRPEKAEAALETALKSGLAISNINKSCLYKLKEKMEGEGKEFRYAI